MNNVRVKIISFWEYLSSEKSFEGIYLQDSVWLALPESNLKSFLKQATDLEGKYEWLLATKLYNKASDLALEQKDSLEAAELEEKKGYCFYRASLQAESNPEFITRMEQAIQTYEREVRILEESEEINQAKVFHVKALISYMQSWLETSPFKKKELLEASVTLEGKALSEYERINDLYLIGKTCNNLNEYLFKLFWIDQNPFERKKRITEMLRLAKKAIKALSNQNNNYELAKAYCESLKVGLRISLQESSHEFKANLETALELSKKTDDAWLISYSHRAAWNAAISVFHNPRMAIEMTNEVIKYGTIARDNFEIGYGYCFLCISLNALATILEDPDQQKETFKKAREAAIKSIKKAKIFDDAPIFFVSYPNYGQALTDLASIETNLKTKQSLLEEAIKVNKEGLEKLRLWKGLHGSFWLTLSSILRIFSETKNENAKKRILLYEAQSYANKFLLWSPATFWAPQANYNLALIQKNLAKIEKDDVRKTELLSNALDSIEKSINILEKRENQQIQTDWMKGSQYGPYYEELGKILLHLYSLTKERKHLSDAVAAYKNASSYFKTADLPTHEAETYWNIAQLQDQLAEQPEASQNYELAAEAFVRAAEKIPQLKHFYENHSTYMQAWSQIEQAKYSHSIEDYEKAKQHYEKAAKLHEESETWNYLTSNYLAWANVEEAESLSRKENAQLAKVTFQKGFKKFCNAAESFKQKICEITSTDEKEMAQRLFMGSDFRRKYCYARILMEDAKLLDREGKYLQSSKNYGKAAQSISEIVDKIDDKAERKELEYVAILCRAWGKMAVAEERSSAEEYLGAAELFQNAKDYCYTRKASLWALGNSSFCKGLAAGIRYKNSMDLKENALAKRYIKDAASSYSEAGFKNASEYAKATQRLFDAYVFMNQAESEVDPEKKAKQYQMAENLLQIAAGSFMKARQPEKTAQVQGILVNVREEKALAVSLTQVMQAPSIASTTQSFTAPSPTSEASVGLENFEHANIQANLIAGMKEVKVGESFCLSIEFVNAGREPALLMRVDEFVPQDFVVVKKPAIYRIEDTCLNMKGKQIAPLKLVEVKLTLQPSKKGAYRLDPRVHYLDEMGQNKSLKLKTIEIKVKEVILEDRVSTGTQELDSLLLGGIPQEYAVILSGSPCDERELIVKNFLKAGVEEGISFFITTEAKETRNLLDKPGFFLFLCNPKPKTSVPDGPNVFKLQGKTDLNNLGIALTKAYRNLDTNVNQPKRICVEILSEVLEDYGTKTTRKWISDLITNYGAKGFTMLAVMNPAMHPSDQATAVIDLFDGEISILQSDDPLDCKKSILVKKLRTQDYIKNPICLI
jgi:hypothetical protein